MSGEYQFPINVSLIRADLVMGVEKLALAGSCVPLGVAFLVGSQGAFRYAAVLAMVSIALYFAGRQMAKADPYMIRVFLRAQRYQRFYPPRPSICVRYGGRVSPEAMRYGLAIGALVFGISMVAIGFMVTFR